MSEVSLLIKQPLTFQPVIICFGSSIYLLLSSRYDFQTQILCLTNIQMPFQQYHYSLNTFGKTEIEADNPTVVTNENRRFLKYEKLKEVALGVVFVYLEPVGIISTTGLPLTVTEAMECESCLLLFYSTSAQSTINEAIFSDSIRQSIGEASNCTSVILCATLNKLFIYSGCTQKTRSLLHEDDVISSSQNFLEMPLSAINQSYLTDKACNWIACIFMLKAFVLFKVLKQFRHTLLRTKLPCLSKHDADENFFSQLILNP